MCQLMVQDQQAQTEALKAEYRSAVHRVRDYDEIAAQLAPLRRQLAVAENLVSD